jgi:hypothetical protein
MAASKNPFSRLKRVNDLTRRPTPRLAAARARRTHDRSTAVQHIRTQEMNCELSGRLLVGREIVPSVWAMDYRNEV